MLYKIIFVLIHILFLFHVEYAVKLSCQYDIKRIRIVFAPSTLDATPVVIKLQLVHAGTLHIAEESRTEAS
jgi:hypothetical protein